MARTATRKGKRPKPQKPQVHNSNSTDPDPETQFNVQKAVDKDKKIRPKEVFEDFKDPKKNSKGQKKK